MRATPGVVARHCAAGRKTRERVSRFGPAALGGNPAILNAGNGVRRVERRVLSFEKLLGGRNLVTRRVAFLVYDCAYSEPFGAMYLSTIAKAKGFQTRLFVAVRDAPQQIIGYAPDCLAVSMMSSQARSLLNYLHCVRSQRKITTIAGGPHPTFFPEVAGSPEIDAICVGEGEYAFARFLDNLATPSKWDEIPNLSRSGLPTQMSSHEKNLDVYGVPDRELVYADPGFAAQKMKSFSASRGCPFRCTYCFNHAYNRMMSGKGPILRRHSVDHLITEIKTVRDGYGLEFVRFPDDCFALRVDDWLKEFCERYGREVGIPFWIVLRPSLITEEMAGLLRGAGCYSIGTSIETGDYERRKTLLLRESETDENIRRGYALLKQFGFRVQCNCMLGLPGTTIADDVRSIEFMVENKVDFCQTTVFTPFPGTDLYRHCVAQGLMKPLSTADIATSMFDRSQLNCFTEREKSRQLNLTQLSALIGLLPRFRRFFYQASKLPSNPFFRLLQYAGIMLAWHKLIDVRLSVGEVMRLFRQTIRIYLFHSKSKWDR
jgi:radical SAM superfamily enzyme YgiQ (UPF0313 family)